jgi:outer membrane protein assembly factor BamB
VADGKVITYGIDGMLTCWNVADGKQVWQKNEFVGKSPTFHTSSAPIVVDGLCVAQLGGARNTGAMVAYELATGNEKWRVTARRSLLGLPSRNWSPFA